MRKPKKLAPRSGLNQEKLYEIVMKFIIKGIHPLRTVEEESFNEFTSGECESNQSLTMNLQF